MAALRDLLPRSRLGRAALLVCVAVWVVERVAEASGTAPLWAAARLDDLVCLPLVLSAVLALHRLAGRPAAWRLPLRHGLLVATAYGLFFEFVLPRWDPRAVGDAGDIVCYAAGLVVFQLLINRDTPQPLHVRGRSPIVGDRLTLPNPNRRPGRTAPPWTRSKPSVPAARSRSSILPTA